MMKMLIISLFLSTSFNLFSGELSEVMKSALSSDRIAKKVDDHFRDLMTQKGTETGDGGDYIRASFIPKATKIWMLVEDNLKYRQIPVWPYYLRPTEILQKININSIKLSKTDVVLDNGGSRVYGRVLNLKDQGSAQIAEKYIDVSQVKSERVLILSQNDLPTDQVDQKFFRFVIHEGLRLVGINDDNSLITNNIINQLEWILSQKPDTPFNEVYENDVMFMISVPQFSRKVFLDQGGDPEVIKQIQNDLDEIESFLPEWTYTDHGQNNITLKKSQIQEKPSFRDRLINVIHTYKKSLNVIKKISRSQDDYKIKIADQPAISSQFIMAKIESDLETMSNFYRYTIEKLWPNLYKMSEVLTFKLNGLSKNFNFCESIGLATISQKLLFIQGKNIAFILLRQNVQELRAKLIGDVFSPLELRTQNQPFATLSLKNDSGQSAAANGKADAILKTDFMEGSDGIFRGTLYLNDWIGGFSDVEIPVQCKFMTGSHPDLSIFKEHYL
ncbi:MAG: hypothetical protein ACPGJV_09995 [Bacteriovoracaceae bacterium]